MIHVKAIGNMNFQAKFIIWSTRVRGSVARSKMKTKRSTPSFRKTQMYEGTISIMRAGACQPPRNKVVARPLTANIPRYSAMKKAAYLNPEYSVMCPATISDSPSGTSNGVRFDSTKPDTKNNRNAAAPHGVNTNQRGTTPNVYSRCAATIVSGISEPTTMTTGSTAVISGNS